MWSKKGGFPQNALLYNGDGFLHTVSELKKDLYPPFFDAVKAVCLFFLPVNHLILFIGPGGKIFGKQPPKIRFGPRG